MKRIGALSGMRWIMLSLVFQAAYTADVAVAHRESDESVSLWLELNPLDYIPLAVGNRWTYRHSYYNGSYAGLDDESSLEDLKQFEIPGYPHGYENPIPPHSLTSVRTTLTIEITHTEMIDGLEYFVFSGANYAWPPVPDFFWGGKKVRLSDEGFLVFRWNGQDVPLYDLDQHYWNELDRHHINNRYIVTLPGKYDMAKVDITRGMRFYSEGLRVESPDTSSQQSVVHFVFSYLDAAFSCDFLHGYGIGFFHILALRTAESYYLEVSLTPTSANIDGEEIAYQEHTLSNLLAPSPLISRALFEFLGENLNLSPPDTTSVQPTLWGQLKQLFLRRNSPP